MKKSLICLALAISLTAGAQTYFSTDFSGGLPPSFSVENADGWTDTTPYRNLGRYAGNAWLALLTNDKGNAAMCPTYHYSNTEPQCRLMILPELQLPALADGDEAPMLRFESCSYYRHRPESLRVLARRSADEDWVELLSIVDEKPEWTCHFVSLADYCGAPVQLAFDGCTPNGFLLAVDDVFIGVLSEPGPLRMVNESLHYVGADDDVRIRGRVFNQGATMRDVVLQLEGFGSIPDFVIPEIATGQEVEVAWTIGAGQVPATVGIDNPWYTIRVKDAPVAPLVTDFICKSSFERRHVVERFSATWCTSCPSLDAPLERLVQYYGDQMIPVGVHMVNDPMYNREYNNPKIADYIFNIPAVAFNHNYTGTVLYSITANDNYNTKLPTETIAAIRARAEYDRTGNVGVVTHTQFDGYYDNSAGRYAVGYALLGDYHVEDYRYDQMCEGVLLPAAGAFYYAASPMKSNLTYFENVPVPGATAYAGVEGSLPTQIEPFTEYPYTFTLDTSRFTGNALRVLVMVIDTETMDVLNADLVEIGEYTGVRELDDAVIGDVDADSTQWYDLTGRRLNAPAGLHIERKGNNSKLILK